VSPDEDEDDELEVELEDEADDDDRAPLSEPPDRESLELFREPDPDEDDAEDPDLADRAPLAAKTTTAVPADRTNGASAVERDDRDHGDDRDHDDGERQARATAEPGPHYPKVVPREAAAPVQQRPLRVMLVGGARGGVGKTVLAANLGLYLSTLGRKVVLVDADAGGANLHTCLGTAPATPLSKLRRVARASDAPRQNLGLADALQETPFRGLSLLHLGLDEPASAIGRGDKLAKMMSGLRELDAEYVVVDLGVGLSRELIDNYLAADTSLFVTVPEPTAIENTYRFVRGAFARFLLQDVEDADTRAELERKLRALGGAPAPLDLLRELEQEGHSMAELVQKAMERFHPHVAINQTRLRADLELGFAMQSAARRRLGVVLDYAGHVDHDDTVWTCVRNRRPLLLEVPGAKSSRKIEKIARHLLMLDSGKAPPPRLSGVPGDGHHDLLEIERGASDEDIRRAFKRCREVYAHEALCCYGLFEPHEIEKLRARLDEAFDVLVDPARRRPYELSVFPDEPEPKAEETPSLDDEPARPAPDIAPDTQFTGELLRQVRESQRVTLQQIHKRTKISLSYLRAIEDDDYARLPEVVYAGGFLRELARHLKLDPQQVSRSYVGRYKRFLDDKQRAFARKH
jgi:flagellar biosynthesis protein FlhG